AEVAWASSNTLNVYDLDGRAIWAAAVRDSSGLAACSGYDIDGDGAYEVLFADEDTFYIFDGRTGEVRFSQGGHASGTLWEYPAVADADNDGSAEIVMASNFYDDGWGGITVFGQADDQWLKSGSTWHTHDVAVSNILPGGTVPARPEPWWQTYNVYRARPTVDYSGYDLEIAITDVCFAGCEDASAVQLAVQVSNIGIDDVQTGVPISLYSRTEDEYRLIETRILQVPIPSGRALPALEFVFPYQDWGRDGVVVRVDDWGSGRGGLVECNERNNLAEYTDGPCLPQ
ncbi:MAG: FG-GAP repeat domain-containing protein, partial [Myxococcota bacterium]